MAYAYKTHEMKYTEFNGKSYDQRQISLYNEMLALDTMKLK